MRLASWVSIAVIALGAWPFFLSCCYTVYSGHDWDYQFAMVGDKFIIFGLATLTICEIFKTPKSTKQEKAVGSRDEKN